MPGRNPPAYAKPHGFGICYESAQQSGCIAYRNGRCAYAHIDGIMQKSCSHPGHPRLLDGSNPGAPLWDLGRGEFNVTYEYVVRGMANVDAEPAGLPHVAGLLVLALVLAFLLSLNSVSLAQTLEHRKTTVSKLTYYEHTEPIKQHINDRNSYRLIQLTNKLEVLCTQNHDAKQASAALSINIGSSADPPELQGLAHLLGHMLPMGSKAYPEKDGFENFVAENNGQYNHYTGYNSAYHYFSVDNSKLKPALDRFSHFFKSPLMSVSHLNHKLGTINGVQKILSTSDIWRFYRLLGETSNPNYIIYKRFLENTGAEEDMVIRQGAGLQDELVGFFEQHYSADIMRLVVTGNHSLDQLTEWAVAMFSEIPSLGNTAPATSYIPFMDRRIGKVVHFESPARDNKIIVAFRMPGVESDYPTNIILYAHVLLKRQGPGSLIHYLKNQGWATSHDVINCFGNRDQLSELAIVISATPLGMKNYKDVVRALLAYIKSVMDQKPAPWYEPEIKEIKKSKMGGGIKTIRRDIHWAKYQARFMLNPMLSPKNIILGTSKFKGYDEPVIPDILSYLSPTNYSVYLRSSKHHEVQCNLVEPFFKLKYSTNDIPFGLTAGVSFTHELLENFRTPEFNRFMAMQPAAIAPTTTKMKHADKPVLLRRSDKVETWFKQINQFHDLCGSIRIGISVPTAITSPQVAALTELFSNYAQYVLRKELRDELSFGYSFSVRKTYATIEVSVDGFSAKMLDLIGKILERIAGISINEKHFQKCHARLMRDYLNTLRMDPYFIGYTYLNDMCASGHWKPDTIVDELEEITMPELQEFSRTLFARNYVKVLVSGYFKESSALAVANMVESRLEFDPLPRDMQLYQQAVAFEPGYFALRKRVGNPETRVNSVTSRIFCGSTTSKRENAVRLFLYKELGFFIRSHLRVKEKLGDIAIALGLKYAPGSGMLEFVVQGEHNPVFMKLRIDSFLREYRKLLEESDAEKMQAIIHARAQKMLEKTKTIIEETNKYWKHIIDGTYNFNHKTEIAEKLQRLTKEDVLAFWDKYLDPDVAPGYCRIDCQMWAQGVERPSKSEFAQYSTAVVAFYCCLCDAGVGVLSIGVVDRIVREAGSSAEALERAREESSAFQDVDGIFAAFGKQEYCAVTRAAEMAFEETRRPVEAFGIGDRTKYEIIGLQSSPNGVWLIKDADKFKAIHQFYGQPVPVNKLVPVYPSN
ncbi:metalloprotease [Coemansia interrupta]|uniref:Metalloprotease n=1 Tax=Coemansia interrupta TaxID=1126814 RepID=A0A9W8HD91_9FUNG|nr:metalloprotease [Coemansia interrupta]